MWISRKTSEIECPSEFLSQIGVVSVGGAKPAVITDGEMRSAEIALPGGVLYLPRVGEEVVLERTCDDERVIMGVLRKRIPSGLSEGDIFISAGGSSILVKGNGAIELSGTINLTGRVAINGILTVNGAACPCGG